MTKMYKDTTHIFNGKDKPMQTGLKEIRDVLRGNQIVPPFMCWMHTWSHPDCHMRIKCKDDKTLTLIKNVMDFDILGLKNNAYVVFDSVSHDDHTRMYIKN